MELTWGYLAQQFVMLGLWLFLLTMVKNEIRSRHEELKRKAHAASFAHNADVIRRFIPFMTSSPH